MSETQPRYEKIRIEDLVDDQVKQEIAPLNDPWLHTRLQTARYLAFSLVFLFGFTIICDLISSLLVVFTTLLLSSDRSPDQATKAFNLLMDSFTNILPYIATPLGVALGYFFKDSRET